MTAGLRWRGVSERDRASVLLSRPKAEKLHLCRRNKVLPINREGHMRRFPPHSLG